MADGFAKYQSFYTRPATVVVEWRDRETSAVGWLAIDTLVGEMTGGSLYNDYSAIYEKWFGEKPMHTKYYFKH